MEELLEQEEQYRRINEDLELRSRRLMRDVEETLRRRSEPKLSISITDSPTLSNVSDYDYYDRPTESTKMKQKPKAELRRINSSSTSLGDLIPSSARGLSAESMVRFLKAKVKLMQEQMDNCLRENSRLNEDLRKCRKSSKDSEETKLKLTSELVGLRDKSKRKDISVNSITEKLNMRDKENSIIKKEIDILRHDLRKMQQQTSNNEIKLNKAKEENEKLRNQLKSAQLSEKEAKEKFRSLSEEMSLSVGKLEREKEALLSAIKKQIYLIDNLKTQKAYLELNGLTNYCEEEFLKLLNWRPKEINS